MGQPDMFYKTSVGDQLKDDGQEAVASHNVDFLRIMRSKAMQMAITHGRVTSDDLREYAAEICLAPDHPNAWGAVFRCVDLRKIGYEPSRTPSAHSRVITIWGPR